MYSISPSNLTIRFLLIALLALGLAACGGGGGGGGSDDGSIVDDVGIDPDTDNPAPDDTTPDDTTPDDTTPTSLDNKVVLYIRPPATSNSDYLPQYGITLESDTQHIWRYVPDLGQSDLVDQNYSPSYASSAIFPYSVDDRVFVREEWRPFETGGHHDFTEYSTGYLAWARSFNVNNPYYFADGCSAVVGDYYYYKSHRNYDYLYGYAGGHFYRYQISTGDSIKLVDFQHGHNCFGNLLSDDGALYDVFETDANWQREYTSPTYVYLYQRYLDSGLVNTTPVLSLMEEFADDFERYEYAVSGGTFYTARKRKADGNVEVWRQRFSPTPETEPVKIVDVNIGDFTTLHLDVDDGHLMLATYGGTVYLLDTATNTSQQFSLGVNVTEIVQVYVAN